MRSRALLTSLGMLTIASTHLWCASDNEIAPPQDGGSDAGMSSETATEDASVPVPTCSDSFCRVAIPGMESVALDALWARSASEVWVVGSRGFAARFDGTTWRRVDTGTRAAIHGVAATADGIVWGVGSSHELLLLNRETGGKAESLDGGFKAMIDGVSAFGTEIYAVGTTIKTFEWPPPETPPMPDNIWRYGPGRDGSPPSWRPVSPPCPMGEFEHECSKLHAVWVESSEHQWFAGDDGKIFRSDTSGGDAGAPDRIRLAELNSSSLRRLNGLWGFSGSDVWAVGDQGVIRHWNGEVWSEVASPIVDDLHSAWGSRPDDVWAVGDDGAVLHWDGQSWTLKDIPFAPEQRPRLHAVTGTGTDVWIAGEGALLRSNSPTGGDR